MPLEASFLSTPMQLPTLRSFLYLANSIRSATAARRYSSSLTCAASSRKVGPSNTKHSTSGELTVTVNSDSRLRSSARSPKCWRGASVASTSRPAPPSLSCGRRVMTHSPLTMTYQTSWRSPSWIRQSPSLNFAVEKLRATSIFSCLRSPHKRSTSSNSFTTMSMWAWLASHMILRNCAWLTHQTTESSMATAVDVRGAWYRSASSPKQSPLRRTPKTSPRRGSSSVVSRLVERRDTDGSWVRAVSLSDPSKISRRLVADCARSAVAKKAMLLDCELFSPSGQVDSHDDGVDAVLETPVSFDKASAERQRKKMSCVGKGASAMGRSCA
mmetsp:Transcript_79934/g.224356  ORF Transcript_79934/g.224356 Transcript_79934/m.224356 type:complete len:328 (-) Transcript_79934:704-1687(-)